MLLWPSRGMMTIITIIITEILHSIFTVTHSSAHRYIHSYCQGFYTFTGEPYAARFSGHS